MSLITNLVAYYDFSGNLNDGTGAHNGAIVGSPTFPAGKIGQGFLNTGGSGSVSPPLNLGNVFSISAWVKISGYASLQGIFAAGGFGGLYLENALSGRPMWYNGVYNYPSAVLSTPLATWTHIVITYDSTTLRWYINGAAAGTNVIGLIANPFQPTYIGDSAGAAPFGGVIDMLGAWNRVLTATEATVDLWNGGSGRDYANLLSVPLSLTSLTPVQGPVSGGTAITLTGISFQSGATVSIGGIPATSVVFVNSTTLTAVTPALPLIKDVTVTNPDTTASTLVNGWTYTSTGQFYCTSITPASTSIVINFNKNVLASSVPLDPAYWAITGGSIPIQISQVLVSGSTVTLTVNEGKAGETLTVHIPWNRLMATDNSNFDGPLAVNYTSVAVSPVLVQAQVIDNTHVRVIYSEGVQSAGATVKTNYSINNGLTVLSVTQENERNYILETSTQVPSTTYLVTVINVLDLNGNPV